MRAAAFTTPGGPDVLRVLDVPAPSPGPGEIRVRVRAAGVQPFDVAVREGWLPPGVPDTFPRVPGNEFAGVVDETGADVTAFAPGDEVLAFTRLTAAAEYAVVPADQAVRKPASMPWEVAGAFPAAIMTPHIALDELDVGPGDTVLIHAAAGGVGHTAVQLARARGAAAVLGTASEPNHAFLRSLGATPVAYGPGLESRLRALAPEGVDAVIDGAGGEALPISLNVLKDRNRIFTLVEHDNTLGVRTVPFKRTAARLQQAVDLWSEGRLTLHLRATYPLAEAADAHRHVATAHGPGKVVLLIDED